MALTAARRREARRSQLLDAATSLFMTKGVATVSVDEIVRVAGSAKGTFYLYFATKDEVVNAVAERIVETVAQRAHAAMSNHDASPVERLLRLGAALSDVGDEPYERELIEILHRPENRAVHDRISEGSIARLGPMVAEVIADGIAAGSFRRQDPRHAAAFVLAAFSALHEIVSEQADVPEATAELNAFILRGLGYDGEIER
jgi:AcrR family transcriptional regulator